MWQEMLNKISEILYHNLCSDWPEERAWIFWHCVHTRNWGQQTHETHVLSEVWSCSSHTECLHVTKGKIPLSSFNYSTQSVTVKVLPYKLHLLSYFNRPCLPLCLNTYLWWSSWVRHWYIFQCIPYINCLPLVL